MLYYSVVVIAVGIRQSHLGALILKLVEYISPNEWCEFIDILRLKVIHTPLHHMAAIEVTKQPGEYHWRSEWSELLCNWAFKLS